MTIVICIMLFIAFFSSRRRHTRSKRDWSSDVCSSDLAVVADQEVDLTDDDEENPSTDIFAQQSACEKDEQYVFDADRTFEYSKSNNAEDCDKDRKSVV